MGLLLLLTDEVSEAIAGPAPLDVVLDGSSSYDDVGVELYQFDTGDGTVTEWVTADFLNHTYVTPGSYTARLRVRDGDSLTSQWTEFGVEVLGDPEMDAEVP